MPVGPILNGLYPKETVCNDTHDIGHNIKLPLSIQYKNVFQINNTKNRIFQVLARNLFLNDLLPGLSWFLTDSVWLFLGRKGRGTAF
jgi:hypothetical protein